MLNIRYLFQTYGRFKIKLLFYLAFLMQIYVLIILQLEKLYSEVQFCKFGFDDTVLIRSIPRLVVNEGGGQETERVCPT